MSDERLAHLALRHHPDAMLVVDCRGRVRIANDSTRRLFDLPSDAAAEAWISGWQPARDSLEHLLSRIGRSSNWVPIRLSRDERSLHLRARGIRDAGAMEPLVLIVSVSNATSSFVAHTEQIRHLNRQLALHQRAEDELRRSIRTSTLLKRELAHRVKNNLAVISALLRTEARSAIDPGIAAVLTEAASRIMSISLVHELLDADAEGQPDFLDFGELLRVLVDRTRAAICPPHVKLEAETAPYRGHIEVALPLALLANELITNAIKHAFVGRQSGRIELAFRTSERLELVVRDDGVGMPRQADGTFRFPRIVRALTDQLDADAECRVENGAQWTFRFTPPWLKPPAA